MGKSDLRGQCYEITIELEFMKATPYTSARVTQSPFFYRLPAW